jgi:hypothetical protein
VATTIGDTPEFLDIDMEQFPGPLAVVANGNAGGTV